MDKVTLKINALFEKVTEYQDGDTRFIPVKIWLMHLDGNYNGSYFTKEVTDIAIPTLYNTPILAYFEDNSNREVDASDHRYVIEKKNDEIKVVYKGMGIGVIPQNCNPHYEKKICDDKTEREFLVVDGLLWRKWDEVDEIFERDLIKAESMEIDENYTGHFNKDGYFQFDSFKFFGACVLGKDVLPAMSNATIETCFSNNEIMSNITKKLEQYQNFTKRQTLDNTKADIENKKEGGKFNLTNEQITAILTEFSIKLDSLNFEITEDMTEENFRAKLEDFKCSSKDNDNKKDFSLTVSRKRDKIRDALPSVWERDENDNLKTALDYYICDFDDKYVYVEKDSYENESWSHTKGRLEYAISETDEVSIISEFEEMTLVWLTLEESKTLEKERATFSANNSELVELREFKANTIEEQNKAKKRLEVANVFLKFDKALGNMKEYSALKEKAMEYEITDLEKECYVLVGMYSLKNNEKADKGVEQKDATPTKFSIQEPKSESNSPYGDLFERYSTK